MKLGGLCVEAPHEGELRMEVDARIGFRKEGGKASIAIYAPDRAEPIVTAQAWNAARDDPCDSGGATGSAECLEIVNAQLYKVLAVAAYGAHRTARGEDSHRLARQLNVAHFAASVMDFCIRREADSGGGHWPYFWALSCKGERLRSKLAEIQAWRACKLARKSQCKLPSDRFDRSRRKDDE